MGLTLWLGWISFVVILLGIILTLVESYSRKG
jgi:hypothetical protein